jgi:hypothetical protein
MTVNLTWTTAAAGGALDLANGQVVTEAVWDAMVSNLNVIGGAVGYVGAAGSRATDQSIPSGSTTLVSFTSQEFDSATFFTPTSTTFTVVQGGIFLICGYVTYASNATGYRTLEIFAAGAVRSIVRVPAVSGEVTGLSIAHVMSLNGSETVEARVFQSSGGSVNITAAAFGLVRV